MNVDRLRFLDRYIGIPLCWMCTVPRWLGRLTSSHKPLPPPRKVLIIKLSEMGSTVLAYPALVDLRNRCPNMQLFFLVFKNNAAIIEVLEITDPSHIVTIDCSSTSRLLVSGFVAFRRLMAEKVDTVIDMDFFSRFTAVFSFLVCRGNRVGYHRYNDEGLYRGNLLTHRVLYSPHTHTSVAFMALIRSLFEKPEDEPHFRGTIDPHDFICPTHTPAPEDIATVKSRLQAAGFVDDDRNAIILVNPNSSDIFPLRKWPLAYFTELCERLLKTLPGACVVITGVASERADAQYILHHIQDRRCIDFTGKTNFRELLALYSIASLMVTNDSGPAHFASLLELPTIVLFGPETPRLYSPLGRHHKDLYADFACSPCVSVYNGKKSPCQDNRCLKAIMPDQLLKEVLILQDEISRERRSNQERIS
jgi:ADP-heptose:LPS heptosyltransferase